MIISTTDALPLFADLLHPTSAACTAPPTAQLPEGSYGWNSAQCSGVDKDFVCIANCKWPEYDGPGFWSTCLGGNKWSGVFGFCLPRE
jgi:hypothetical protein